VGVRSAELGVLLAVAGRLARAELGVLFISLSPCPLVPLSPHLPHLPHLPHPQNSEWYQKLLDKVNVIAYLHRKQYFCISSCFTQYEHTSLVTSADPQIVIYISNI
jgi:hypothetical protein